MKAILITACGATRMIERPEPQADRDIVVAIRATQVSWDPVLSDKPPTIYQRRFRFYGIAGQVDIYREVVP